MKLLRNIGLLSFGTLVLININPKLTFVQSMPSSIDMTPSAPEIKTSFSKVEEYILTVHVDWLNF